MSLIISEVFEMSQIPLYNVRLVSWYVLAKMQFCPNQNSFYVDKRGGQLKGRNEMFVLSMFLMTILTFFKTFFKRIVNVKVRHKKKEVRENLFGEPQMLLAEPAYILLYCYTAVLC